MPALAATPAQPIHVSLTAADCSDAVRLGIGNTPFNAAVAAVDSFDASANVEDFLDELRRALDDSVEGALPPPPPPPPLQTTLAGLPFAHALPAGNARRGKGTATAHAQPVPNHHRMSMMSDASTAVASTVTIDSSEASPTADIHGLRAFGIDLGAAPRTPTLYAVAQPPAQAPHSLALSTKSFPLLASACRASCRRRAAAAR